MKITRPMWGKIISHDEGLGTPSAETVRQRARELAMIDGRETPTEQDWKRAFLEVHGAPTLGRHVHQMDTDGADSLGEELITEGLEEASHDRMLESRRKDAEEDKENP